MNTRILASLLVIGVAGAFATGSTFALFSDTETSESNVFTAGAVDLMVGWNETYNNGDQTNVDLTDLGPEDVVFNLDDVKPGDEGEATLFWHVYDNPAYVWMRANLTSNDDSSSVEPELATGDPQNNASLFDGELADNIRVELWYDNGIIDPNDDNDGIVGEGDNIRQEGEPSVFQGEICRQVPVDVAIVMDRSGSMDNEANKFENAKEGAKLLFEELAASEQGALASFATSATLDQPLTNDTAALNASVDGLTANGNTNIEAGIDTATSELINGTDARNDASKVLIVLTDGQQTTGDAVAAADRAKAEGIRVIAIGYGSAPNQATLEGIATSDDDVFNAGIDNIQDVFATISNEICEPGTLRNLDVALDEGLLLDADLNDDGPTAYVNSTTRYMGFAWNLPLDVGNEVQTDSATLDIEFYAEQERNNPNPQNPFATN